MASEKKDSFPNLPSSLWWQLREKFIKSIPSTITPGYVATALGIQESSAKANVMPSLFKLGFIDENYKPTDRIYEWRDDNKYAKVCSDIIKEIYPEELIEALPAPNPPREAVERWFANKVKVGANAAKKMAILYETLCEADYKKGKELLNNVKSGDSKQKNRVAKTEKKTPRIKTNGSSVQSKMEHRINENGNDFNPTIHIDIQIHISPEATAEQIDKIFLSMSKHIFKKKMTNDEN